MNKEKTIKDSKTEYGTMTAKFDANNDYSQSTTSSSAPAGLSSLAGQTKKQSSTSSMANQTLTAKKDANEDYTS